MIDPTLALTAAIDNATKVASTPLFTTIIDRITGFRVSKWAAEWEVRKRLIHDEYEKAKQNGIMGVQYIESIRHTTNLIDVATKSTKYINYNKDNNIEIDNDFFWNTIEYSKNISNQEMQELIAKIIAGEYNNPGSYSMSTLQSIKMLGKEELELFERMGTLLLNDNQIPEEIFSLKDNERDFLDELKIDFGGLQVLQNLGLFLPNSMMQSFPNPEKKTFLVKYYDKQIKFKLMNENELTIEIPTFYWLSTTGKQIIKHLNPNFSEKYYLWLKKNYKITNYNII